MVFVSAVRGRRSCWTLEARECPCRKSVDDMTAHWRSIVGMQHKAEERGKPKLQGSSLGMVWLCPVPAHTPPPTAREIPTLRPTASATTVKPISTSVMIFCFLVRRPQHWQVRRFALEALARSCSVCLVGQTVHSFTRPSMLTLGCDCVVTAERGRPLALLTVSRPDSMSFLLRSTSRCDRLSGCW